MTEIAAGDAGLHFLLGLPRKPALEPGDRDLLARLRPAGIVLFRDNFRHDLDYPGWHAALAALLDDARRACGRERLIVAIDHEGGNVMRVPPPVTPFAFPREWADPALAFAVGRAMAVELASLGIGMDLAPCLDVNSNADNPVIGRRAFGTSPESVVAAGRAFLEGLEGAGLTGCLKHFPGHGATGTDPHYGLPSLDHDLAALEACDLVPFARLVAPHRPVMTAHILFPAIDAGVPATLSRHLIHYVLRGRLGHEGVVVSDDMNMAAIARHFGGRDLGVRALAAGIDLVCVCAHFGDVAPALDWAADIERAIGDGRLDAGEMVASRRRIQALLARVPQPRPHLLAAEVFATHRTLAPLHHPAAQRRDGGGAATI